MARRSQPPPGPFHDKTGNSRRPPPCPAVVAYFQRETMATWAQRTPRSHKPAAGATKNLMKMLLFEGSERKPVCFSEKERIWQAIPKAHDPLLWKARDEQLTLHGPYNCPSDHTRAGEPNIWMCREPGQAYLERVRRHTRCEANAPTRPACTCTAGLEHTRLAGSRDRHSSPHASGLWTARESDTPAQGQRTLTDESG